MNLKNISALNLRKETLDDISIDHVAAISSDEFNNKNSSKNGYRANAIDRLIKNKLSFWNNCNLTYDMVQRFVSITCPYCNTKMEVKDGGGSANVQSVGFVCSNCKSQASLTLVNDDGLYFSPKED